jgi:hypothetical protein
MLCLTVSLSKSRIRYLTAVLAVPFLAGYSAKADGISFQLVDSSLDATSGGSVTFQGTVTNQSGADLNASDFFFNFFGYDFNSVNPVQDLGGTDFAIPNGSTSGTVDMFDVFVGQVPLGSTFPIEVQLQDALSDVSSIQTVSVSVPSDSSTIPEPRDVWTALLPLVGWMLWRRRKGASAC